MADTVWHRIDRELQRRKDLRLLPGSWAALGRAIDQSNQTLTNWKTRGVPPKQYQALAEALGWSVDELLGKEATATGAAPPPPPPPADFSDRLQVTPSDWGLLQAVKVTMTEEQMNEVRKKAAQVAANYRNLMKLREAQGAPGDLFAGGLDTNFGLPEDLQTEDEKRKKGSKE